MKKIVFLGLFVSLIILSCTQQKVKSPIEGAWQLISGNETTPDTVINYPFSNKGSFMKIIGEKYFATVWQDSITNKSDWLYSVTLRPDVTMDKYVDFLKTKVVPEYDKNFPGSKMTIGCPDSWSEKNQYCFLYSFDSEKEFNKYIRNGTGMSDEPKAAWEKTRQSLEEEGSKYILDRRRVEVEWETWMEDAK